MVQYDVTSPEEYLEVIEADWRKEKLLQVRALIFKHGPELDEDILYKMLAYGVNGSGDYVFALNAQKHYVSFYVGAVDKIPQSADLLASYSYGKGCIRIRKTVVIAQTGLEEFIEKSLKAWRQGQDIYC